MDLHCKFSSYVISILASQIKDKKINLSLKLKKKIVSICVFRKSRVNFILHTVFYSFVQKKTRGKVGGISM